MSPFLIFVYIPYLNWFCGLRCHLVALIFGIAALIGIAIFCTQKAEKKDQAKNDSPEHVGIPPAVGVALITATLLLLFGIIIYPNLKDIKLSGVNVCGYCELRFFKNFQNQENGICKLCSESFNPACDLEAFSIFPNDWEIIDNFHQFRQRLISELNIELLKFACAENCENFLLELNQIKEKKLSALNLNQNEQKVISQILLLDQLALIAACKTISECSEKVDHNCNKN